MQSVKHMSKHNIISKSNAYLSDPQLMEWKKQSSWIADLDTKGQSLSRLNVDHLNEKQIDFIRTELEKNHISASLCSGVGMQGTTIRVTGQENVQKLMNILEKPVSLYGPRRK